MEYLNEYFGFDRSMIKQEVPLNLVVKNAAVPRHHPYVSDKGLAYPGYQYAQNHDYYQDVKTPLCLNVSRTSIGSPSCTSDSESSVSSSSHERFCASPVYIGNITTSSNNIKSNSNIKNNSNNVNTNFNMNNISMNNININNNTNHTQNNNDLPQGKTKESLELDYQKFREEHLSKITPKTATNQNMRRTSLCLQQHDDPTYREKREKNNLAAKKSRDARKQREDEMVVRCAFLESELMKSCLLRKQDKISIEEETIKLKELDLMATQQLESINEFQKLILQLKSNNNNNGMSHSHTSLSI